MKLKIVTSRSGGPRQWGHDLSVALQKREKNYQIENIHSYFGILSLYIKQFDILHATIPITQWLPKKKSILTVHGNYKKESNRWSKYYPSAIRAAAVVTVPSRYLQHELGIERALVIPNGIRLENFQRKTIKVNAVALQLLTITNFHFQEKAQGIIDLVRILTRSTDNKKIELNILGEGIYIKRIQNVVTKIKKDLRVNFLGFQENRIEYLQKADVFLYYSYLDNMPIVVMEAMACGLPVISNDIGAINELISDGVNGFIACSPDEYAIKLEKLLPNCRLRESIGDMARITIQKNYNLDNLIKKYIEIYDRL